MGGEYLIGMKFIRNSIQGTNNRMKLDYRKPVEEYMDSVVAFGCRFRFRFRSVIDSYSIASEAFSEKQQQILSSSSSLLPIRVNFDL
ncbi:hypothetical protein ERO13_A02G097401v2 [Gossypium hirsutum]|nr:hypothetical protein ERO13_A02G097401v2 [Gossypium hirsutum]